MMFSRAASLRRLAAPAASSLLRPAAAASTLSTTAKAAVRAPEAAAATAPQQAAGDRLLPPHLDPADLKRPTEIPFQPQIANTVHLVGTVGVLPVLEEKSPGDYQAVSVIVEKKDSVENDSLQSCIPVIFQGDLAQIAALHLKENDLVYIVGRLSGGEAMTKVEDAQSKIRIFARSLSFCRKDDKMVSEQDKKMASQKDDKVVPEQDKKMSSDHSAQEISPTLSLWNDLLSNPGNWSDNRAAMTNPSSAAFKHKDEGHLLWLNEFTPKDVLSKLDTLAFSNSTPKWSEISGHVKDERWWTDIFVSPGDWNDNRIHKQNGTLHPKYPDFKHKSSGQPLWLVSAPGWVQSKLDDFKPFGSCDLTHEDLWKDVIENPTKWWDTRLNKRNPKSPDFKHKDSGVVLWLSSSPSWVLEKLPPTNNRLNKLNPKSPDFMHKDNGVALWLNSSPSWVLEKLPPAESTTNTDSWAKATILS